MLAARVRLEASRAGLQPPTLLVRSTLRARRRPRHDRSREMVERIIEADRSLLQEVGFKGLTTIAIGERDGLSVGSL